MSEPNASKNNNAKVVYGLLTIVAVIGGMSAIVLPMQQSIDGLRSVVAEHRLSKGHSPTTAELAAIRENLKEVETQFQAMRDLFDSRFNNSKAHRDRIDERVTERGRMMTPLLIRTSERLKSNIEQMVITARWIREHDLRVPGTDSAQWERIKALERRVYGSSQSPLGEKGP